MNVQSVATDTSLEATPVSSSIPMSVLAGLAGGVAGASLSLLLHVPLAWTWAMPILGIAIGQRLDFARKERDARSIVARTDAMLVDLTERSNETHRELGFMRDALARLLAREPATLPTPVLEPSTRDVAKVDTKQIADGLARRANASTNVRASVFTTRDAPAHIEVNVALFEGALDELVAQSLARTTRGSIVVEVSGERDELVIMVSDSGEGREEELLRDALGEIAHRAARMHGAVEALSKVGRGTTVWLRVPVDVGAAERASSALALKVRSMPS